MLRALAGLSALLLCADPLARVLHLHDDGDRHGWCEAHGHVVHLDIDAEAIGTDDASEDSLWATGQPGHQGHHECPAVTALRSRLTAAVELALLDSGPDDPALPASEPDLWQDVLSRAPKQGPPASA